MSKSTITQVPVDDGGKSMTYTEFPVAQTPTLPKWDNASPAIPLHVRYTLPNGRVVNTGSPIGGLIQYDAEAHRDDNGLYHVAHIPKIFPARLRVMRFEGGRSAANIVLFDVDRLYEYYMPAADAVACIQQAMNARLEYIEGNFSVVKRGANYRLTKVQ